MSEVYLKKKNIDNKLLEIQLKEWLDSLPAMPKKVLLVPPDITRSHSKAGDISQILFKLLEPSCHVSLLPALGTHNPMSNEEIDRMFGKDIPKDRFLVHNWREGVEQVGEIPVDIISGISEGLLNIGINVELNKELLDKEYDQIISIGQVVPNEVVGMGGYSKNILVGCGGEDLINKTHFIGAAFGMENMLGRGDTPIRKIFNYAEDRFLCKLPITYILTVTTGIEEGNLLKGLFIGKSNKIFNEAVELSRDNNITFLDKGVKKVVAYLDPNEFKSTWLGDKAIYRTRMIIEDGGELLIIAPGVKEFGEDKTIDRLIRKYGHVGRDRLIDLAETNEDLKANLSAAAHLIHGSTEGRFKVTYSTDSLSSQEFEDINISHQPLAITLNKYSPEKLKNGFNRMPDGEEIFFVTNPALGLWALKRHFQD